MRKYFIIVSIFVGLSSVAVYALSSDWKVVSSQNRTFCGSVYALPNSCGYDPEIYVDNYKQPVRVSRELCESVYNTKNADECQCIDVLHVESEGDCLV